MWVVILVTVVLPRLAPPAQQSVTVAVSQLTAFDRSSALQQAHAQRVQAAQMAQVQSWSQELKQGLAEYQAKQAAEAAAQAQAEAIAARNNHPAPPPEIGRVQPAGARCRAVGDEHRLVRVALPPELGQLIQRGVRAVPVLAEHVVGDAIRQPVAF